VPTFVYRAALLAASAVATASSSLRTDATREARSERARSASSSRPRQSQKIRWKIRGEGAVSSLQYGYDPLAFCDA
ncbi:hypothetical protein, partial [Isoptericola variabilis]|uniref:hypothetical protein n=1 Tax=Isoptericola variabilis TaxID=139208 RepID=UPI0006608BB3